jgi:hypothetical protein
MTFGFSIEYLAPMRLPHYIRKALNSNILNVCYTIGMKPTFFTPETIEGYNAGRASRLKATDLVRGDIYTLASLIDRSSNLQAALLPVRLERIAARSGKYGLLLATLDKDHHADVLLEGSIDDENIFAPYYPERARIIAGIDRIGEQGIISASYFSAFEGVNNNGLHLPAHLTEYVSPQAPFSTIVRH